MGCTGPYVGTFTLEYLFCFACHFVHKGMERTYMYFVAFYEQHSKLDPRNYTHSNGN